MKFLKVAWDAIGSEFGSRHTQYEMFYAGARFVTTGHSYRTFDWNGATGMMARRLRTQVQGLSLAVKMPVRSGCHAAVRAAFERCASGRKAMRLSGLVCSLGVAGAALLACA